MVTFSASQPVLRIQRLQSKPSCIDKQEEIPLGQPNRVRVRILSELMKKLVNVEWDEATQREIAEVASVDPDTPSRTWLRSLLEQDGMVDAFRHFYPTAEGYVEHLSYRSVVLRKLISF